MTREQVPATVQETTSVGWIRTECLGARTFGGGDHSPFDFTLSLIRPQLMRPQLMAPQFMGLQLTTEAHPGIVGAGTTCTVHPGPRPSFARVSDCLLPSVALRSGGCAAPSTSPFPPEVCSMNRSTSSRLGRLGAASTSLFAALCGAAAVVLGLLSTPARAATVTTWTGGGGNVSWSDGANWTTAVNTSDVFNLVFGGTTQDSNTNNLGTVNVSSLSFVNSGSLSDAKLFQIAGSPLSLASTSITTAAATNTVPFSGDMIDMNLTVTGANTVTLGTNHPLSFNGNISGGGSLAFGGGGSSITISFLSGSNSYSGGTLISGGFVQTGARVDGSGQPITSNDFALGGGSVTVSGSGTLLVRNNSIISNLLTISGSGAGSGSLTGSFGLAGQTAEYRGNITVAGDTRFSTASSDVTDTTSKLLVTGNVDLGSSLLTLRSQRAGTQTTGLLIELTGTMSGAGGVNVASNGTWGRVLISGSNSYSGGTTVTTGTLIVGNGKALGDGFLAVNTSGLDLNGQTLLVGTLSGSSSGVISSGVGGASKLVTTSSTDSTYAGRIIDGSGPVGLTKAGSGVLSLTGSNTYTGTTGIDGGVLALDSASAIAGGGGITFGGGTLRYSAVNQVDFSSQFANSTGAISINTNGQTVTYASPIANTNSGGLTKSGAGTLYLNAANQFSGTTTVAAGTLAGTGSVLGPLYVAAGGTFDPGSGPSATTIFGVGSFAQVAGGTTKMQITGTTAGSQYDQVLFSGTTGSVNWGGTLDLTLSGSYADYTAFNLFSGFGSQSGNLSGISFAAPGSPYAALTFGGPVGTTWSTGTTPSGQFMTFDQATGVLVVVPEPGSVMLAALSSAACGLWRLGRWRRRAAA